MATGTKLALRLTRLVLLLSLGALYYRLWALQSVVTEALRPDQPGELLNRLERGDELVLWAAYGLIAASLLGFVLFVLWQIQHARNAKRLGPLRFGPAWAVLGWLVPPILPAVQLSESARVSDVLSDHRAGSSEASRLIVRWVILSILGIGLALYAWRFRVGLEDGGHSIRTYQTADGLYVGCVWLSLFVVTATIRIVRVLTSSQEHTIRRRQDVYI